MLVRFDCLSSLFVCDRCTFNDGAHFLSALDCRLLVRRSISPAFCLYHIVIQGYSIRGPIEFCFLLNRAVAKYRCALCRLDILILYEYFCYARVFRLKGFVVIKGLSGFLRWDSNLRFTERTTGTKTLERCLKYKICSMTRSQCKKQDKI